MCGGCLVLLVGNACVATVKKMVQDYVLFLFICLFFQLVCLGRCFYWARLYRKLLQINLIGILKCKWLSWSELVVIGGNYLNLQSVISALTQLSMIKPGKKKKQLTVFLSLEPGVQKECITGPFTLRRISLLSLLSFISLSFTEK